AERIGVAGKELDAERGVGRNALREGSNDLNASGNLGNRSQRGGILEIIGIAGITVRCGLPVQVLTGVVGCSAVVRGVDELVREIDAEQESGVAAAVFEDRVAQNAVAAVLGLRGIVLRGIAENRDAAGAIELHKVAQAVERVGNETD